MNKYAYFLHILIQHCLKVSMVNNQQNNSVPIKMLETDCPYHAMSKISVLAKLNTDDSKGLSKSERKRRLAVLGENTLPSARKKSLFFVFFSQFTDFMIFILLAASALSYYASWIGGKPDLTDSIIILTILIINAIIGTVQEMRAEKALTALKNCQSPEAIIVSDGKHIKVPAASLVPGDIIEISAGCIVPADARLISSSSLETQEASLTGESSPVVKNAVFKCSENVPLAERFNMLYSSTIVSSGHGRAVITGTGINTEIGKIAGMLDSGEAPETPLMIKMNGVSRVLGLSCLIICGVIFGLGIYLKYNLLNMFMTSISLAVAAIPEGLPAVVTIMLSIGVVRLSRKKCIIRNLSAAETLGGIGIICSDKTGTLTLNKMTITSYSDGTSLYNPEYLHDGMKVSHLTPREAAVLNKLLMHALPNCCMNEEQADATERAILALSRNLKDSCTTEIKFNNTANSDKETVSGLLYEFPFSSERKACATLYRNGGTVKIYAKGAFDKLMPLCKAVPPATAAIHDRMTGNALRVLCVTYKECSYESYSVLRNKYKSDSELYKALLHDMQFIGLFGILDPPRPEVKSAIYKASRAGIRTIMITGDHLNTAKAIANIIGIRSDQAFSGNDLDKLSDEELTHVVQSCSIFARVSPKHKVRLVKACQSLGYRTVMTGDGINDSPALKCADIGAAMGINGTDVAKEVADLVLADDNYATLVDAISEGRGIYDNIRKSIHFLLSCNTGEILTVLFALVMGLKAPLAAIQLLWINLITDSLPAIALGMEKPSADIMNSSADYLSCKTFSGVMIFKIVLEGALIASVSLIAYLCYGQTGCFVVLGMSELMHSFNLRSEKSIFASKTANPFVALSFVLCSLLQLSLVFIPKLSTIFELTVLSPAAILVLIGLSVVIIAVSEVEKLLFKK
jgi:Ca2+-transporting ATPase